MTPGEVASVGVLYILYTIFVMFIGMFFGATLMASYFTRQMHRIHNELTQKLLAPPPLEKGDEWKKNAEDEAWLRKQLDNEKDNDENKETQ